MSAVNQIQRDQLNKLIDYRNEISNALFHIEHILQEYFPSEFDIAYQHWIPQITTALYDDKRWLPRGQYTMQQTIDRVIDKNQESYNKGVSKYI